MKLEMTTNWLPLLEPGLYGTRLGNVRDSIHEDYATEFETVLCSEFTSIMNEIFSEQWFIDKFSNYTVSNAKLNSPRYYNYVNDSIEFDLEIEKPELLVELWNEFEAWDREEFYKFARENFGSHSGFISFFPYEPYKSMEAFLFAEPNGKYDYNRAVAMLLMFEFEKSKCALDSYQCDFEVNVEEYCSMNGFDYYEEDEE